MGVVVRGIKNAFRNLIRTGSIALILGLSIGLALVMLISLKTIQTKIESVKSSIGNTITISPAGARGFEGGGEPLTEDDIAKVRAQAHVIHVTETLNDRLQSDTTNLVSAIDPGTLGRRFNRRFGEAQPGSATTQLNFSLPVTLTATNEPTGAAVNGNALNVTTGALFAGNSSDAVAVVGKALAAKNNLAVGSTFTAYNTSIKVVGIYDAGNQFSNSSLLMPLATVQKLSGQAGQLTSATIQVDSVSNLASVASALSTQLGSKADVVSAQDTSAQALTPLENIATLSLYSLIGALAAGAVIIFLNMLMIVRERRREIGILKAIGASNLSVVIQFVTEATTLTLLGSILGVVISALLSNTVLHALTASSSSPVAPGGGGGFRGGFGRIAGGVNPQMALHTLHATVGLDILLYGLAAAVLIAVIGSAIPAFLTAKVRPAEVLRGA